MGVTTALNSKGARQLSAISMLVEAGLALARGRRRVAAMLLGAAVLAYRYSVLGFATEVLIRLYQWQR